MLRLMRISDFAIIDSLEVAFGPGLNVLTGETGAGKSIIFEALNLTLGGRGSADLVRSGAKDAVVESLFGLPATPGGKRARAALEEAGIDVPPDGELIVRRRISTGERSRLYLNGALATAATLSSIAGSLVNIHGQHAQQTLLKPSTHLGLLDDFAGLTGERGSLGHLTAELREAEEELEAHRTGARERAQRADLLQFQVEELERVALSTGELESIEDELPRLRNADRLGALGQGVYEALYGDEGSIIEDLGESIRNLERLVELDPSQAPLLEQAASALAEVESLADSLRDYFGSIELDPERLEALEVRRSLLRELLRKYGNDEAECLAYLGRAQSELAAISDEAGTEARLDEAASRLREEVSRRARDLSRKRQKASGELDRGMSEALAELGLPGAVLETKMGRLPATGELVVIEGESVALRSDGIDACEFHFSPNPGEPPRPLARIASGGELSRLMLALESVLRRGDMIPTLIFDEVDAGIGGGVAEVVGRKLQEVSENHQVLVITHLPQVACLGDRHFRIEKRTDAGRTATAIEPVEDGARIEEIARMGAGLEVTAAALRHAGEMLEAGKRRESAKKTSRRAAGKAEKFTPR
ncbi:MAG: DNA repair protein RecN [Nitrospinota bacterium]|nr:DNA repair protein RecN [Nitrospinota bacterium]HJP13779.1 DNA repair protein RecN [Nitrospinota bacterium]